jgi:uncharacterized protein YecE (DUF72 family)
MLQLRAAHAALANFFASGVLALGSKLGPILWQLPERVAFDSAVLEQFLAQLPRTTNEAAQLATDHDERLDGRNWITTDADRPIRHALEVRNSTFVAGEYFDILRRHNVASVIADSAGRWPKLTEISAAFSHVRLHGETELYVSGYDDASLDRWATTVNGWLAGWLPALTLMCTSTTT